jgi:zinc protease
MVKRFLAMLAGTLMLAALGLTADKTDKASTQPSVAKPIVFQQVKLKNGMRVILSEDHGAPVYSISMTYNVGSRNEVRGRTGFAHLFEHIMYEGSQNVGKGEHMLLVQENGGTMNGTTNQDRTNYFETLPANQLDLGLFLESDRMRSLALNQANLDNQRNAVQEERRLRVDNQPYGKTNEVLLDTAYDNFAYKHSTIGSMDDLNAASLDDVRQFFRTYYAPNNAVLAVVGDFDSKVALAKIRKYFEDIPSQPAPPDPDMSEPEQKAERRISVEDAFANLPRLTIVFKGPAGNTPDYYALDTVMEVLAGGGGGFGGGRGGGGGGGGSSRLYQKLVREQQVALSVFGNVQRTRGPGLINVTVQARPGKDMAEIEKIVYAELDRLKSEPPTEAELARVRARLRFRRATSVQSTLTRATSFSDSTCFYNDPGLINTIEQKYSAVTPQDMQRVANHYFVSSHRSVVATLPKKNAGGATQGAQ